MAQYIEIQKVDETSKVLEQTSLNFAPILTWSQGAVTDENFPWVLSIDEYGNTIFNNLQVKHVARELERLNQMSDDSAIESSIQQVITVLNSCGVHEYIKFLGD